MSSSPLVSIIMPCLNCELYISEAILSVINQSYKNIELIIVDDGSTDGTIGIIESFTRIDPRVRFFRNNEANHGVSIARNIGISESSGKFICFLDSDDYLLPESIMTRVDSFKNSDVKLIYGPYLRLLPNGKFQKRLPPKFINFRSLLIRNHIGNLTGMYDVEFFGKQYQSVIRHEDYLMWCKMLNHCGFAYSTGESPIAVYRVSANSLSGNKIKSFYWHWIVLRKGLKLNIILAFVFQFLFAMSVSLDNFISRFTHVD